MNKRVGVKTNSFIMKEIQINEVGQYLKDGFVLVVVEDRTFIQYKNQKIYLYNSQWHSTMPWSDFYPLYQKMHFVLYEEHQELVDEKKDEEYYQWASKYQ